MAKAAAWTYDCHYVMDYWEYWQSSVSFCSTKEVVQEKGILPAACGLALSLLLQRSKLRVVYLRVAMPQALGCAILPPVSRVLQLLVAYF